jgi:protein-S-isoprenylcysteine O-methyltransferase Ste14
MIREISMHVIDIVIFAGWVAFWIYWLAASIGVKAGQTQWTRFAGVRVGIILLLLLLLRVKAVKEHEFTNDPWLEGIGLAVFLSGLALAIWARVYLGRNWGMPMSQKADPELVTTGPYSRIRHPIYSGIILAMIGTTIAVSLYWLVAVVLLGAYFVYSAVVEERFLAGRFPDSYPEYKQSTKMLIPFIFLPLGKFFHLRAEDRHLGQEPTTQGYVDNPEVLDDELASHGQPLELLAAANARELVLVTAQQEEAIQFPSVRLEESRLEALDLTLLLQTGVILEGFVEHLDGLSLAASHGSPETDKESGICHVPIPLLVLSSPSGRPFTCHRHDVPHAAAQPHDPCQEPSPSLPRMLGYAAAVARRLAGSASTA